ncbi:serine hydrolase domain-containing protein [Spongisporangium articulatum]|uniref:Serine hydrolase domain-containing protein n=1 Tax=Spongisporangium articulatum TaxID=3362603 RepID=A0ABW8AT38_9ACTN
MVDVLPSTAVRLLARVARAQRDGRIPSVVAGVFRDGALAWSGARGAVPGRESGHPAVDVQYRLGSISKTVTAIAVLRLRDEGLVSLTDRLEQHLPGTPLGERTLAELLTHLGGLASETPVPWWERIPGGDLAELGLSDAEAVLPAGRRFHYSNLGFGLLGTMVARLRGAAWIDVVTAEVLQPLGMTRTTARPSGVAAQGWARHPWADVLQPEPEYDAGDLAPAGQLWATAADLSALGRFLLGDTGSVLSPDTVEEMVTPFDGDSRDAGWSSYGLGVQVSHAGGVTLVGHGGSMPGFLAGLWVDRSAQAGALVLANVTQGLDHSITRDLLATLAECEPHVGDEWVPAEPPVPLSLLGPWYWGPAPFVLKALPGGLLALDAIGPSGRESRFGPHPTIEGAWIGLDAYYAGETLRFSENSFNLSSFIFTREPYDPAAPVPGGVSDAGWTV